MWGDLIDISGNNGCDELWQTAVEVLRLYRAAR
jgi:hypothetical protein